MSQAAKAAAEVVGPHYDAAMIMAARALTRKAVADIAAGIRPGMSEAEGLEHARAVLAEAGLLRGWHAIYVRFGTNTLMNYGAEGSPDVVLGENDIFFVDIGPVWRDWEGDAGDTFVTGDDPEMHAIARDVKVLFRRVQDQWRAEGLTGEALYAYADAEACAMGWVLNLAMPGHRLSDFPHSALHKGYLSQSGFTPSPGLWVLEVQIRHPTRPFSAFYEDLLLADTQ